MINLNDAKVIGFKPTYIDMMYEKLNASINSFDHNIINPFTSSTVISFLTNDGQDTVKFLEDLLTEKIKTLNINYTQIKNYYQTAMFVFLSNFKIHKELKNQNLPLNQVERELFRERYVNEYMNEWIDPIVHRHPSYKISELNFNNLVREIKEKLISLNEDIFKAIRYQLISKDDRHKILYNYGIEVCPYCNRNFISNYELDSNTKEDDDSYRRTTGDLDHHLPKVYFQIFSLSLDNFVPSCQICNSRFKAAKMVETIHPYNETINYSDFKFIYKLNKGSTLRSILDEECDAFDIDISTTNVKYLSHIELFKIRELYKTHKPLVAEVLFKKEAYNNSYFQMVNDMFDEFKLTESEMNRILYGIEMEEGLFYKRPLSKLIFDILKNDEESN